VGDLIEIARKLAVDQPPTRIPQLNRSWRIKPIDDLECKYYLRLRTVDQAGVLAEIARILGEGQISLASVLQKGNDVEAQTAEIVITTHPAREASLQQALEVVSNLKVVLEISNVLRIEE